MPNETRCPSDETIRQMARSWRNTQRFQNQLRNRLWSEFLGWWNHRHTTPAPETLWGVREWYEDFYGTIFTQGCTIPQTAPHFIKFGTTSSNYTDMYYPSGNVIVRFYEGDTNAPDVEIDN
tara:strand:+ start:194 stop:556 length:363 start_codon:yes stop_codon:yes gene_type:complete